MEYKRFYWDNMKEYGSSVILVDVDNPGVIKEIGDEKEAFLTVNKYIEHSSNSYGLTGLVNIYDIIDRAIDNKGNLILFVKNNRVSYDR